MPAPSSCSARSSAARPPPWRPAAHGAQRQRAVVLQRCQRARPRPLRAGLPARGAGASGSSTTPAGGAARASRRWRPTTLTANARWRPGARRSASCRAPRPDRADATRTRAASPSAMRWSTRPRSGARRAAGPRSPPGGRRQPRRACRRRLRRAADRRQRAEPVRARRHPARVLRRDVRQHAALRHDALAGRPSLLADAAVQGPGSRPGSADGRQVHAPLRQSSMAARRHRSRCWPTTPPRWPCLLAKTRRRFRPPELTAPQGFTGGPACFGCGRRPGRARPRGDRGAERDRQRHRPGAQDLLGGYRQPLTGRPVWPPCHPLHNLRLERRRCSCTQVLQNPRVRLPLPYQPSGRSGGGWTSRLLIPTARIADASSRSEPRGAWRG